MTQPSEQQLVAEIQQGDRIALGELLRQHYPRLFNVSLRMLGNRDDAAECVQESMLKAVQHFDSFDGRASVSTWVTRITMNQAISLLRRRKVRRSVSLDQPVGGADTGEPTALSNIIDDPREPGPGERVERGEMLAQLQEALDELDEPFRSILVLRDIEQIDYQQISEVLDVPTGTVKSRLFRARLALRQEMMRRVPDAAAGGSQG